MTFDELELVEKRIVFYQAVRKLMKALYEDPNEVDAPTLEAYWELYELIHR